MPWKMDGETIAIENGNPVWIDADNKEVPFDADSTQAQLSNTIRESMQRKAALKDLEAKYSSYSGVDLEKYQALLKKEEEGLSENQKAENALQKLNKKIEEMDAAHKADLADRDAKLKKFHLDEKSRKAAIAAGVKPERVEYALDSSRNYRKLDDSGAIVIVDSEGDPTGKTLEDFFSKDFKEMLPDFYAGIPGGGGAPNHGKFKNNADLQKLSPVERLNAARAQA